MTIRFLLSKYSEKSSGCFYFLKEHLFNFLFILIYNNLIIALKKHSIFIDLIVKNSQKFYVFIF